MLRKRMTRMKSMSHAQNLVLHLPRYRVFSGTAGTGACSGTGVSSDVAEAVFAAYRNQCCLFCRIIGDPQKKLFPARMK
jgi:hypothetical protein